MLEGRVCNAHGLVGIRVSSGGGISKVYTHSPAAWIGIKKGDRVLSCDGTKGPKNVDGEAYTYANMTIIRKGEISTYRVFRLPKPEIYDE